MDKKYKYRYKTEKELFKEFGEYWEENVDMNDDGHMDYLLGSDVIVPDKVIDKNGDVVLSFFVDNFSLEYDYNGTWIICPELIVKEQILPAYMLTKEERQKRFIYE